MRGTKTALRLTALAAVLMIIGACTAQHKSHGYMPPKDDIQMIVPGVDTRASVEDLIGSPNTSGVLNESGFYYIQSNVRHFAWQRPKVTKRQILAITFDQPANIAE